MERVPAPPDRAGLGDSRVATYARGESNRSFFNPPLILFYLKTNCIFVRTKIILKLILKKRERAIND